MGFRQAAVLTAVSFFAGVLFICMNVDLRILYAYNDQALKDGFIFYTTFYNAPHAIRSFMHAMMGIGVLGFIAKLHKWDDSAMFFDGGSLAAFVFAIIVYLSVSVPAIRTVVTPVEGVDTPQDQAQAMQLLSAGNVINVVLLAMVLGLQAGQEYARRQDAKAMAEFEAQEQAAGTGVSAEKKTQ